MKLRVGTFNILNTSCRYGERLRYLKSTLDKLNCDIIGIQEVNLLGNSELLNVPGYFKVFCALPSPFLKEEPEFRIDGNAILLRDHIKVIEEFELIYSNNLRQAQFLHLRIETTDFILGNTHLDHLSDITRSQQVKELLGYCEKFQNFPIIITGDFNFIPYSAPYMLMVNEFKSSFKEINKHEAAITFPTGLYGKYADVNANGAFDYIWISNRIKCTASKVFTDCGEGDIWASDHFPVSSDLIID